MKLVKVKIDNYIDNVFKTMIVAELKTLHAMREVERTQLLTILAMSVDNPQLSGFLLTQNRCDFLFVKASAAWFLDCPHPLSPLYVTKNVMIKRLSTIFILFYMLSLILAKLSNMQVNYPVKTTLEMFITLGPDTDQNFVLFPKRYEKRPPQLIEPL